MNKTGKSIDLFLLFFVAFALFTTDFNHLTSFQYCVFALFGLCLFVRLIAITTQGRKK